MSSINTNIGAMVALDTLKGINKNMGQVQQEISTGKTINSAKDNAAIWSISTVMETDVASFEKISSSLNLGSGTVGVARAASENIVEQLQSAKDLIVEAQGENIDRSKIQSELNAIFEGIDTVVGSAQFNGKNLLSADGEMKILQSLDRSSNGTVTTSDITVTNQNLSTADGRDKLLDSDAGFATVATDLDNSAGRELTVTGLTVGAGTIGANEPQRYEFTISGENLSVDVAAGSDQDAIATALANEINGNANLTAAGITASVNGTNANVVDFTVAAGADATVSGMTVFTDGVDNDFSATGDNVAVTTGATFATASTGLDNTNPREQTLDAVTIGTVADAEGQTYKLSVGDKTVEYTATAGQDQDAVASGIVAAFATAGVNGVTAAVNGTNANQIDFTVAAGTDASVTLQQTKANSGEAVGGLAGLDLLDVTVDAGDALSKIDDFLQTAIDAAAEFGSKQNRIDNQLDFVSSLSDSLKAGISTLTDANLEETSARLQALQVQQQLGVQALSIANQAPQALLGLFR
ncbi:MAG: flagellin [Pseudomonadota bacterium]